MSTTAEQPRLTKEQFFLKWKQEKRADSREIFTWADMLDFAAAYAHSRITSLAEEAEREAEAHYNIAPPHRYHADLDQCKFKRAIAAWLRQKAEEREGSI